MIKINCPCCGKEREISEDDYAHNVDKYPCLDCECEEEYER